MVGIFSISYTLAGNAGLADADGPVVSLRSTIGDRLGAVQFPRFADRLIPVESGSIFKLNVDRMTQKLSPWQTVGRLLRGVILPFRRFNLFREKRRLRSQFAVLEAERLDRLRNPSKYRGQ